ncbi:glycosyltransferase family 4 protein [Priestia aryabhattai]|uniref:glycosyltransferase family 4 protein n=1 Tax=Priestia aryabhattai TaxID=412384 RepID=UPI001C8DEB37|nr:glycosyltransferase family 1 protein [Priestia aryabhattai]MBX9987793.1 glycosyltransferase family 4 protein [Priestia aryabhattai]
MDKIYINGRFLTQRITGVQRVAEEIIKKLDQLITDNIITEFEFCILTPGNTIRSLELQNITVRQVGKLKGHAWEQLELPIHVKNNLLVNFCNTAPIYKKNQIVYIHDTAVFDAPEGFSNTFIKVYEKIFNSVAKRAKKVITVSNFSKKQLISHFPEIKDKISYCHLGVGHIESVDLQKSNQILKKFNLERYTYFLAVSSANPNKNFRVISDMLENNYTFEEKFVLVGGNSSTVFSEEQQLSNKISHLGYVSDQELIALYQSAKGFIFPSRYEGFGLPPVEAMSQGCPVVASECASIPEVLQENAIYFDYKNYSSLYLALNKLKEWDIDREKITDFSTKQYSWEKTTKHLYNTILEI